MRLSKISAACVLLSFAGFAEGNGAAAKTFKVIHSFGPNDFHAAGTLKIDSAGNLYGVTGTGEHIFKLTHSGSAWSYSLIANPSETMNRFITIAGAVRLVTTDNSVLQFVGPSWTPTTLHQFPCNGSAPCHPTESTMVVKDATTLFGLSAQGGSLGNGTIYQLKKTGAKWSATTLKNFANSDGSIMGGLTVDPTGNLYGTTGNEGSNLHPGAVFMMSPGTRWTYKVLYKFKGAGHDGVSPSIGPLLYSKGVIYGTTQGGGKNLWSSGIIFSLTPSGSTWKFTTLHELVDPADGGEPNGDLVADSKGNLYGTTSLLGISKGLGADGTLFELVRSASASGKWTYKVLHTFTGGLDGGRPFGGVVMDKHGVLYGTASAGGTKKAGVVWSYTP